MKRNESLKSKLDGLQVQPKLKASISVPKPDTVNIQGFEAYSMDKWQRLISMLTTLKVQDQFYKSASTQLTELKEVVDSCAKDDAVLVAKAIVWARCISDGMRTVSHVATAFLLPHLNSEVRGQLLNLWNKKAQKGGTIYRADDMATIVAVLKLTGQKLPRKLVRTFASNLEKLEAYNILKYKKEMIDLSNLVHPNPSKSKTVEYNGEQVSVIEAIMKGYAVSADTWEVAQSDAGQQVAKAFKEGKITKEEATEILTEAKNENWIALLEEGKLGILAALRNIRNILKGGSAGAIKLLCALVSNGELIRKGKVLPHQLDTATQIVLDEFSNMESREIVTALCKGYEAAIPNLAEVMTGKTCVFLDVSGSMQTPMTDSNKKRIGNCLQKAALITATIAKATNADIIVFEGNAKRVQYNPNMDVWTLAKSLQLSGGSTNMAAPWSLITNEKAQYDRIVVVSDNEANGSSQYTAYKNYIAKVADPYVYSIDLAAYGTHILKGEKLRYYYGYGYEWMNQIMKGEVKLTDVLEEISKVKF